MTIIDPQAYQAAYAKGYQQGYVHGYHRGYQHGLGDGMTGAMRLGTRKIRDMIWRWFHAGSGYWLGCKHTEPKAAGTADRPRDDGGTDVQEHTVLGSRSRRRHSWKT